MNETKLYITSILFFLETILLVYFSIQVFPVGGPTAGINLSYLNHVVAYLVYGLLGERMLSYTRFRNHRRHLAFLIAVAVGGINEVLQAFVPGRVTDVLDLAYDGLGAFIGIYVLGFVKNRLSSS